MSRIELLLAEQFLEERNLPGQVHVVFSLTSLKEQNTVSNLHLQHTCLQNQMCSTAS